MPKVQVLKPEVIAKIAAGEVVERPASVVKELVENAIDAGASSIEVHLADAGKELIHVRDNGLGISKEDLNTIFQRHATSKIQGADDLQTLLSMGFRGEALYSIAAVSDVVLESQAENSSEAWQLNVRAEVRQGISPCAPKGRGTDIKVSQLFFNTPARRKFLKNNTSELNALLHTVLNYTLLYPNKSFLLTHAGRTLIDARSAVSFKDRMAAALNLDLKDLLETSQDFPQEKIYIHAVFGNINIARSRRDMQYIFINERPVEHKSLSFALNDIYRLLLPPGVYGAFMLKINIDPSDVDANIHPSKKEVRLHGEGKIIALARQLAEYTLMQYGGTKTVVMADAPAPGAWAQEGIKASQMVFGPGSHQAALNLLPTPKFLPSTPQPQDEKLPDLFHPKNDAMTGRFHNARYIGQFRNKYLIFEEGTSLLCVDMHAAQERIMYERFLSQIEDKIIESQILLTPIVLKLNAQELLHLETGINRMQEIGIETTMLDNTSLAIHSQPLVLGDIEAAVRTILGGDDLSLCDTATIARRACKASVKAGDRLKPEQVEHQRKELLACRCPFTCPHGRPIIIELTERFLDGQFLRS